MYFIYKLFDLRTDVIGYIGITDNPYDRFRAHIRMQDISNQEKNAWIQSLKDDKLIPGMGIIEIVESLEQARERERYWIKYYVEQGHPLTNINGRPVHDPPIPEKPSIRVLPLQELATEVKLLSLRETCKRLEVTRSSLYTLMSERKLDPVADTRSLRKSLRLFFREEDVERLWVERKSKEEILDAQQAADLLHISRSTLYLYVKQGRIHPIERKTVLERPHKKFYRSEVERFVEERQHEEEAKHVAHVA